MNSAKKIIIVSSVALNGLALCVYLKYWDPARQLLREGPKNNPVPESYEKVLTPKALLKEAILQQRTRIESCYDDYLRREPSITNGSIAVTWFVDERGNVKEAEIADTELQDLDLEECV